MPFSCLCCFYPVVSESYVSELFFNLSVIRMRNVFQILATHPKDITVIGLFEFFEKNNEFFSGMVREEIITMKKALIRLCEANKFSEDFLAEFVAEHAVKST